MPAEELSFWDLFPEDLPPPRPVTYPTEDLLADHLALPDGPDSVAARLAPDAVRPPPPRPPAPPAAAPAPPAPPRPVRPAEAENVIAELLDGPVPTGLRAPDASAWAPVPPGDDYFVDDLVTERGGAPAAHDDANGGGRGGTEEQNRIAADQARRRRTRRGGGGRRGGT